PHGQPGVPGDRMRSLATRLDEADPDFMDLRIKIHSTPGPEDLTAVLEYRDELPSDTDAELRDLADELVSELRSLYRAEIDSRRWQDLGDAVDGLPVADTFRNMPSALAGADPRRRVALLADLLRRSRDSFNSELGPEAGERAVALLDAVRYAGAVLEPEAGSLVQELVGEIEAAGTSAVPAGTDAPATRRQLLGVVADLVDAAYGTGWLTEREHEALIDAVNDNLVGTDTLSKNRYRSLVRYVASATDWAQAAVEQTWGPVIEHYRPVEPLAARFRDDVLRGSVLLPYARLTDLLSRDANRAIGMVHGLFGRDQHAGVLGLNPGVAVGPLRFIDDARTIGQLDPEAIYVLPETPADLGRVAGILTLREGSSLSHVQLLARNLGIPNAVIPAELARRIRQHEGQDVFYAVSAIGSVILKESEEMTAGDVAIFQEREVAVREPVELDVDEVDLSVREILGLAEVSAEDSGRIVGPKAANLGQLRRLFPERVAPGLVVPFGVFTAHVDRDLDGDGRTLRQQIDAIYARAREAARSREDPVNVQNRVLRELATVRETIVAMDLLPGFRERLTGRLQDEFGEPGTYGVFVRSDTNVEDLPTFSGAGLNFTAMNQVGLEAILDAIREVWASPYTERSYMWRQRILADPGSVYPSILLLRSVPADASGVLVTTDLSGSHPDHWTVTLSPGIGGVVEGEPAETVLLPTTTAPPDAEPVLLSSARATWQKVLQGGGGVRRVPVTGEVRLLTPERADDLRTVVTRILERYPPVMDEDGEPMPWDIEFGFVDDRTMLFQIRPFATDRLARTLTALSDLDSRILERGLEPLALDIPPQP
ncbi:MAG: PEP/pyruvate-binding domain-containing protein, partial [Acidobacteriota bacterium]